MRVALMLRDVIVGVIAIGLWRTYEWIIRRYLGRDTNWERIR